MDETDKDSVPGNWDKVMLYRSVFNNDQGQEVLNDLKRMAFYDDFDSSLRFTDSQAGRVNVARAVINYIQHLSSRELKQQPEERLELDLINE